MSLIVAGLTNGAAWMVGDMAISGGDIPLRVREYEPKIVPIVDGIVGYAGDWVLGNRALTEVRKLRASDALAFLSEASSDTNVQFALAAVTHEGPVLHRILPSGATRLSSLFIGSQPAYEIMQRLRVDGDLELPPHTLMTLMMDYGPEVPEQVPLHVMAMLQLFAYRAEHDVGGWPTPYVVTASGSRLLGYGYSSLGLDAELVPGEPIPAATAGGGGYEVRLIPADGGPNFSIICPQMTRGRRYTLRSTGYRAESLEVEYVRRSGESAGIERALGIIRDEKGRPRLEIRELGGALQPRLLDASGGPFRASGRVELAEDE